jgi:hypothetical protein
MLKPKVWVATSILTLLAVSDAWADGCKCRVHDVNHDLDYGFALSIYGENHKYVENRDEVTVFGYDCWRPPHPPICWAEIDRTREPPASGWIRDDHVGCRCEGFVGATPRTPPPPPPE